MAGGSASGGLLAGVVATVPLVAMIERGRESRGGEAGDIVGTQHAQAQAQDAASQLGGWLTSRDGGRNFTLRMNMNILETWQ